MTWGGGNDYMKAKGNAKQPCITLEHTIDPREVEYNNINVFECNDGPKGECDLRWLDYTDEPLFSCSVGWRMSSK